MKWILLFIGVSVFGNSPIDEVRSQFPYIDSLEQCEKNILLLHNEDTVVAKAYIAAMVLMKSRFVKSPIKKYQNFKKGKKALDQLIDENPLNIEFRYIRYGFQKNIPSFLGYDKNLEEDLTLIETNLTSTSYSHSFKRKMIQNLLAIPNNTENQSEVLTSIFKKL